MQTMGRGARYTAIGLFAAALLFPAFTTDAYFLTIICTGMAFGMLAMSLDLLWGYSGILNLGPALSFGIGAYTWSIVSSRVEGTLGTLLGLLAVVVISSALAAGIAFVSFRSGAKEIYFALITLAMTLAFQQIAQVATGLTGGANGFIGVPWPVLGLSDSLQFSFDSTTSLYYLTVAVAALAFLGCAKLVGSRFGTVLRAIRESDNRAETLGYSTLAHRVVISAGAAVLAAVAGMLYAPLIGIVDPSTFGVALSVQAFVWVAVGGAGTLIGPLVAALLLTSGQATLSGSSATTYLLATGVGFILVVLFLPGGLASLARRGSPLGRLRRPTPRVPGRAAEVAGGVEHGH